MIGRIVLLMLVVCCGLSAHAAPDAHPPSADGARPPGTAAGADATAGSLPVEVAHRAEARAVDSAKAFLDVRFDAAMRAEAALELYFRALQDRNGPLDKAWVAAIAASGRIERAAPVAQALGRFVESPDGATLGPADRMFLAGHESELTERLERRRKQAEHWDNMFTLPAGATPGDVRNWVVNFEPVIDRLRRLDDEAFERVLIRMAEAIEDPIDVARWKRLLATPFAERARVRFHETRSAVRRLGVAGEAIDAALKDHPDFSGLRPDEWGTVRELLSDALVNPPGRPVSAIIWVARLDDVMSPEQVRFLPDKILALASAMWSSEPE